MPPAWHCLENPSGELWVESAANLAVSDALPSHLVQPVHEQLAKKYSRWRVAMSLLAIAGPVLHSLYGEWDFIMALGEMRADDRLAVFVVTSFPANIIAAAAFPVTVTNQAGARFIFVPAVVCSILRCFGVCLDLYHTATHVNSACALVHTLTVALLFCVWLRGAVLGVASRYTWLHHRCIFSIDGAALLLCNIAIHALGPPPSFSPGNMSFPAALSRGAASLLLGAVLTPANRLRIARIANHAGMNHVTVRLEELSVASEAVRADLTADIDAAARDQFLSNPDLHLEELNSRTGDNASSSCLEPGSSSLKAGSYQTAKLDGTFVMYPGPDMQR